MNRIDQTYQWKRLEMRSKLVDAAAEIWVGREWAERSNFLDKIIPFVEGGMSASVQLLESYLVMQAQLASGDTGIQTPQLDISHYTIENMRGVPATEVYDRPYGTLGTHLMKNANFKSADEKAAEYVKQLAATDLQLAETRASRDWMVAYELL